MPLLLLPPPQRCCRRCCCRRASNEKLRHSMQCLLKHTRQMRLISCPRIALLLSTSRRAFSSAPVVTSKARAHSSLHRGQQPPRPTSVKSTACHQQPHCIAQVFFDVTIGGAPAGRVSIGLFGNDVPKVTAGQPARTGMQKHCHCVYRHRRTFARFAQERKASGKHCLATMLLRLDAAAATAAASSTASSRAS